MAIIELADLKTFLGITGTSEDDLLQIYLDATNEFVGQYCKRTFEETEYTQELYDGTGHVALNLRNYPIVEVEEVLVETEEVTERTDVGEEGYYIQNADWGILYNDDLWSRGRGNVQVTYTAGYDASSMPAGLKLAAYKIAAYMRNTGKRTGIRSESLGSYSYSLSAESNSLNNVIPDILANLLLSRYRKRDLGIIF